MMAFAKLNLNTSPHNVDSFYLTAVDEESSISITTASKDNFKKAINDSCAKKESPEGLYILQSEDLVVYVGKSSELPSRLESIESNGEVKFVRLILAVSENLPSVCMDYAEAKIYDSINYLGYSLEESLLPKTLYLKKRRLERSNKGHSYIVHDFVRVFLSYAVAFGIAKPQVRKITQKETQIARLEVRNHQGELVAPSNNKAVDTFLCAIKSAGISKVSDLNISISGILIVSVEKQNHYSCKKIDDYWVFTHSNTQQKAKMLKKISDELDLKWEVSFGQISNSRKL